MHFMPNPSMKKLYGVLITNLFLTSLTIAQQSDPSQAVRVVELLKPGQKEIFKLRDLIPTVWSMVKNTNPGVVEQDITILITMALERLLNMASILSQSRTKYKLYLLSLRRFSLLLR